MKLYVIYVAVFLAALAVASTIVLSLLPVYLGTREVTLRAKSSSDQSIVYRLPETIDLPNGTLTDAQLAVFRTAMQSNLDVDSTTRGSNIVLKSGTIYTTTASTRKRRAETISISEESQSTLSTSKRSELIYIIEFRPKDATKLRQARLLQYIRQTALTNLQVSGFNLTESYCVPNMTAGNLSPANVSVVSPNGEDVFNRARQPITLQLSCPILNTSSYTLFSSSENRYITNTTSTNSSITIPNGCLPGNTLLTLVALDIYGLPLFAAFSLYCGDIETPVEVRHENGSVAANLPVEMNLTESTRVGQVAVTDSLGIALFTNVPPMTISVFARTTDNQIGITGAKPSSQRLNITLMPFTSNASKRRRRQDGAVAPFSVFTNNVERLQTRSKSFQSKPNATKVYVEYQFITSEVPGGYFGTQFNDYFSVYVRSATGQYEYASQSMNGLGLGAFNFASGATDIYKLTLPVASEPESIQMSIAVSNVADALLQSELRVTDYGSDVCDECEKNCDKCKSDPMCSPSCQNPPIKSCDFYLSCMEKKAPCKSDGYAMNYGNFYCRKFVKNIDKFSASGQTWVYNTMNCLQKALVSPLQNCVKDCTVLKNLAFDSHPSCYIDNGVCNLLAKDYKTIFPIVFGGLLSKSGALQAIITGSDCAPKIVQRIEAAISEAVDAVERQTLAIIRKLLP